MSTAVDTIDNQPAIAPARNTRSRRVLGRLGTSLAAAGMVAGLALGFASPASAVPGQASCSRPEKTKWVADNRGRAFPMTFCPTYRSGTVYMWSPGTTISGSVNVAGYMTSRSSFFVCQKRFSNGWYAYTDADEVRRGASTSGWGWLDVGLLQRGREGPARGLVSCSRYGL